MHIQDICKKETNIDEYLKDLAFYFQYRPQEILQTMDDIKDSY